MAAYSGQLPWRRVRRTIVVPAPGAGKELTITCPAGKLWTVEAIATTFTASATVATRQPQLTIGDSDGSWWSLPVGATFAATNSAQIQWWTEALDRTSSIGLLEPMPKVTLQPGETIATSTVALDSGDAYGATRVRVIETTWVGDDDDIRDSLVDIIRDAIGMG